MSQQAPPATPPRSSGLRLTAIMPRRRARRVLVPLAAILASLSLCAGAEAEITVGEVAPPNPEVFCNLGPTDIIQTATPGANAYAVPQAGVLTSWSTSAGAGAGQYLALKVYRPVSGTIYSVLAQDGPRALTPGVLNTFPIHIPVQAGDVLGLNDHDAPTTPDACSFVTTAGGDVEAGLLGNGADGSQLNFEASDTQPDIRVNVSATLETSIAAQPTAPNSGPPAATRQCLVPRLGAKKLAAARKALKKAGCRLGRVSKLKGATVKSALVVSQSPQSGKKLKAGAKVAVKLAPPAGK